MDGGGLTVERVIPLLDHADPVLRNTAQWIASHRSGWGEALVGYFGRRLDSAPQAAADRDALATQLAQLGKSEAIQALIVRAARAARQ